jgi:plastocyanin
VVALVSLAAPASASAATVDVSASDTSFTPSELTVAPGDTVKWTNNGGTHNVHFEDGQFDQPAEPAPVWPDPVQHTFPSAGRFAYYCEQHRDSGMTGVITVKAAGSPNPPPTVTPPPTVEKLTLAKAKGHRIKVRLRASAASTAKVTLARRKKGRYRKVKAVTRKVGTTARSVILKARRAGRYRVTVQLTDSNGNKGPARSRKIRLS